MLGGGGLTERRRLLGLVRLVLGLLLAKRRLLALQRVLRALQLVQAVSMFPVAMELYSFADCTSSALPSNNAASAPVNSTAVHVGRDGQLPDLGGVGVELLLVDRELLTDLRDGLGVGRDLGRIHRVLLLISVDLQLLLHELLRDRLRLGLEVADLIRRRGSRARTVTELVATRAQRSAAGTKRRLCLGPARLLVVVNQARDTLRT